ncbi:MAG: hypothetical protein C5B52_18415 [Bacteroidetes bacterium]|nr:MAG: hypothetical protein C5B52_18415 [Bacteroidota bacterium]
MKDCRTKIICILALCLSLLSFRTLSQGLYEVSLEEKVSNSSLIIEGKVVDQQSFWNPQHTLIYTSNKIEVYKIFKGNTQEKFIEVLTQGGTVGEETIQASDLLQLQNETMGLFFCYSNTINLRSPATGARLYDVYSSSQGCLKYDLQNNSASAPFERFKDLKGELYKTIEKRTGRTFENRKPELEFNSIQAKPEQPQAVSITSFSPSSVNAGAILDPTNNLLTITGSGFTTPTGSAAVLFDDADDGAGGTPFIVGANSPLVVSWTDTQIQIRVPTNAGTGTFQVRDNAGNTGTSPSALNVLYSILTVSSGGQIRESNLMDFNGSGGYDIFYSTNTANGGKDLNSAPEKATFQRALTTWKESVGFNITEAGTTTSQTLNVSDGQNVIMFDNTGSGVAPLASGVLAVCYSRNGSCNPVASNAPQKFEFDIVIRNNGVSVNNTAFNIGPCKTAISSTEIDLESVLLHELGHALNLGHIIDSYQGTVLPNVNPQKVMNFAIVNGVQRRNPDFSAFTGAKYAVKQKGNVYGNCAALSEMSLLSVISEARDECPATFPTTATTQNTSIPFDLAHATSDRFGDPQFTAVNCAGTGTALTNNAYYAIKTNPVGGVLSLNVSGYGTTPASQGACASAGVKLALYQVSSCPTGQAYPSPVACRTFNADGAISDITGLAASTNYLILVDGIDNTKASFNLLLSGAALPIKLTNFYGEALDKYNKLHWSIESSIDVKQLVIEKSIDGNNFDAIANFDGQSIKVNEQETLNDYQPVPGTNFYRIKTVNIDGTIEYSKTILIRRNENQSLSFYPNPVKDYLNVQIRVAVRKTYTISLTTITGQRLYQKEVIAEAGISNFKIRTSGFAKGIYVVSIIDSGGDEIQTRKIQIQ